jgi:hypothetical protein
MWKSSTSKYVFSPMEYHLSESLVQANMYSRQCPPILRGFCFCAVQAASVLADLRRFLHAVIPSPPDLSLSHTHNHTHTHASVILYPPSLSLKNTHNHLHTHTHTYVHSHWGHPPWRASPRWSKCSWHPRIKVYRRSCLKPNSWFSAAGGSALLLRLLLPTISTELNFSRTKLLMKPNS